MLEFLNPLREINAVTVLLRMVIAVLVGAIAVFILVLRGQIVLW